MDEITRSLEALGLKPGASEEEIKQAYRELAMVWHPDRFGEDSPLRAKAEAKLKEINLAYEFLHDHAWGQEAIALFEIPVSEPGSSVPADEMESSEPEESHPSWRSRWIWHLLALVLIASIAGWLWFRRSPAHSSQKVEASIPVAAKSAETPAPVPAATPTNIASFDVSSDLLPAMRENGDRRVTRNAEGYVITGETRLQTREEYSPPFVIHTIAKTDFSNIRLSYGEGLVIFNWERNPNELRFHDPATTQQIPVGGKGHVAVNEWQDIQWFMDTNSSRVVVNGEERASFKGNYAAIRELAGIGTAVGGTVTVKFFEVRKLPASQPPPAPDLASGLVLYYPFDSDEGDVVTDKSGFRNNGVVRGAKFVRDGKVGGAMQFHGGTGGGDSITVPQSLSLVSMQRTRQFTVCCWLKPTSLPNEFSVILVKGGNHPPKAYGGYELNLQTGPEDNIHFPSGPYGIRTQHARELWGENQTGDWAHVAVVVNTHTGARKVYINGQRVGDELYTGDDWEKANFAMANNLYIGAPDPNHNRNRAWFDGYMDELRIYARALTPEEIRSLPGFQKNIP